MRTPYQPASSCIRLTSVLHALSDPVRLQIARSLYKNHEQYCATFEVSVTKSTLSHHLKVLRDAGVIQVRVECKQHFYSLRSEDLDLLFPGLLNIIFQTDASLI